MGRKLPVGDDWKDHAVDCPCCKEPVLDSYEHYHSGFGYDPGYWDCDHVEGPEDD